MPTARCGNPFAATDGSGNTINHRNDRDHDYSNHRSRYSNCSNKRFEDRHHDIFIHIPSIFRSSGVE